MLGGEVQVGEGVGLGLLEERAGARRHRAHGVDGGAVGRPHGGGVGLAEHGLHGLAGHRPVAPRGQQGAHVALEVHDAALPSGARQALGDGANGPGVGLGVDCRDAEHAARPVGADADGGDDRRGLHPAVPPALDVGDVHEQVGKPDLPEVPGGQLRDPRVQRPAHRTDLVLREPLYSHLPRRDAVGPRLSDGRRDGAVRPRVPLDQALREVRPRAELGGSEYDVADGGGQPSLAVAVARGGPVRSGHVRLRAHDFVHHGLQERARQLPHVKEPVAVGGKSLYSTHCGRRLSNESISWLI